jgi:hypothetical protein
MGKHQSIFAMSHIWKAIIKAYQQVRPDHCCRQDAEVSGDMVSDAKFLMRMVMWSFFVSLTILTMNFRQFYNFIVL